MESGGGGEGTGKITESIYFWYFSTTPPQPPHFPFLVPLSYYAFWH